MKRVFFNIGPASVLLDTPEKYSDIVIDNVGDFVSSVDSEPDLHLIIHEEAFSSKFKAVYEAGKNFKFRPNEFKFSTPDFTAVVKGLFTQEQPCTVNVYPIQSKRLADKPTVLTAIKIFTTLLKNEYLSPMEPNRKLASSVMSYSLFWFLAHGILLKKNSSFIHASTLAKNGNAILLAGTGGCGKTSTAFKTLEDDSFSYLSEDFTILSKGGDVFYNPKTVSVYASDLRGNPAIFMRYVENHLSSKDRKFWVSRAGGTGINPMHKVAPSKLLDKKKICDKAKLSIAFFLVRGQYDDLSCSNIREDEFSDRSMEASYRELKTLAEIITLSEAVAYKDSEMPSIEKFRAELKQAHMKAVENIPCYLLKIPTNAEPSQVADIIRRTVQQQ